MRSRTVALLSVIALFVLLVGPAGSALAQDKEGDKKEDKDKKASKVWTNEDLKQLSGKGISVVGPRRSTQQKEQASQKAPPKQQEKNFYSDKSMEERQQWIEKLERENEQIRRMLADLRQQRFDTSDLQERRELDARIENVEQALDENLAEIELIRNTPPPPAQPAGGAQQGEQSPPGEKQPAESAPAEPPPASEEEQPSF